jgi:hypothetical protein
MKERAFSDGVEHGTCPPPQASSKTPPRPLREALRMGMGKCDGPLRTTTSQERLQPCHIGSYELRHLPARDRQCGVEVPSHPIQRSAA